jgi:hypothetical protein
MTNALENQNAAPDPAEIVGPTGEDITFETNKVVDLAVTLVVFALGAFIVSEASTFRTGSFPDLITARGLPYITGGFMMFAAVVIGLQQALSWNRFPGSYTLTVGAPDEPGQESSALRSFAVVALALCLVGLLRPVGFLIVTPFALFGMLMVMNVRSRAKLIGFPLGFTAVIWIAFSQILGVVLPLGPLTAVARSWGLAP